MINEYGASEEWYGEYESLETTASNEPTVLDPDR
jgi:hypothetical protein